MPKEKSYFERLIKNPAEAKEEIDFLAFAYTAFKKLNEAYKKKQIKQ